MPNLLPFKDNFSIAYFIQDKTGDTVSYRIPKGCEAVSALTAYDISH